MNNFDGIIGYETIKEELLQICDMIHNKEAYEKLGAHLPQGLLLFGDPGLGKTSMAKAFIKEAGLKTYTVRRNKGDDDFISAITEAFQNAKENAPSVIFLDDMDKFANEDCDHRDAEEYVAVQAGIDEVKGSSVFVIATANDSHKLPGSLLRTGRFDRKICVQCPTEQDAEKIIEYYLKNKNLSDDVNMKDLGKMISYSSCSDLETILNEAAIMAAYERSDSVSMRHLVSSVLRMQYDSPDNMTKADIEEIEKVALHEAGHAVIAEVLVPESIGLVSVRTSGRDNTGGFTHCCKSMGRRPYDVLVSLGGKTAVEMYYAHAVASGCESDLTRAKNVLRDGTCDAGTVGLSMLNPDNRDFSYSESYLSRNEAVTVAELERFQLLAKEILIENREFLEKMRDALTEKETLLFSDIREIRESCEIKKVYC